MISETGGLAVSCIIITFCIILGTLLSGFLRGFLLSLPPLKQNIFTKLDGLYVMVSYTRIFSVSSTVQIKMI